VPSPGSDSTQISTPWRSTIRLHSASPIPRAVVLLPTVEPLEHLESAGLIVGVDADPIVRNVDPPAIALALGADVDRWRASPLYWIAFSIRL